MSEEHFPSRALPRGEKKPGVRTIAKSTGLSVATVSRVLNGQTNVRQETREIVQTAIRELGYTPNSAARALSTRRTKTVAAVIPTLAHSIFARFLNAVELELAACGYALVIGTTDGDKEREFRRAVEMINLGAEGLILSGVDRDDGLAEFIQSRKIPAICTSVHVEGSSLPSIGYDNRELGAKAMVYLQSLGHQRICVVHGPLSNNDRTRQRIKGAEEALKSGSTMEAFEVSLDVSGGVTAAKNLFSSGLQSSAVLCLSDVLALGILFEATNSGIKVPEQLSVMGFDDLDWAAHTSPPLTTIRLPVVRMGTEAARALVDRLDNGIIERSKKLSAEIVIRDSTAPLE